MNQLVPFTAARSCIGFVAGDRASYRFFEFSTTQIRNPSTRPGDPEKRSSGALPPNDALDQPYEL